jgi:hypothetical protein
MSKRDIFDYVGKATRTKMGATKAHKLSQAIHAITYSATEIKGESSTGKHFQCPHEVYTDSGKQNVHKLLLDIAHELDLIALREVTE